MASTQLNDELFTNDLYIPPSWIADAISIDAIPTRKVKLGRFPTPYHQWKIPEEDAKGLDIWVKRDDLSSFDLGGNKVRKLQFLLAEALEQKADCTVTIGAAQSNHCRATAVASRQLGLEPHLILRTRGPIDDDIHTSLVGNLLFDKLVGAQIRTVTTEQYSTIGQHKLVELRANELEREGRKVYSIPVGGSNSTGAFGYLDAIEEIRYQQEHSGLSFDHLVFSCGSGGTATGLSLGARLAGIPNIHGVCVCDTPDIFYDHIAETATNLGVDMDKYGKPESWLTLYDGSGQGYAKSTPEELQFVLRVARNTGVTLDPVYSGKGLYYFLNQVVEQNREIFQVGQKVLFLHTGGGFGLYDKVNEISTLMTMVDGEQTRPLSLDESVITDAERESSKKAGSMV